MKCLYLSKETFSCEIPPRNIISFSVRVSSLELCGEEMEDLLLPNNNAGGRKGGALQVAENNKKEVVVFGLEEKECRSAEEVLYWLNYGSIKR
jgi:hypothetical protein